jgi:photosystem II stability/assembly factor-like uncharacterized protein
VVRLSSSLTLHGLAITGIVLTLLGIIGCRSDENNDFCEIFPITISPNQLVVVGETVQLMGSWPTMYRNEFVSATWTLDTLPSGSQAVLSGANSDTPSFVADVAGTYFVSLRLTTPPGDCNATESLTVTAGQIVANAGPRLTVDVGAQVTLDGTGSVGNVQTHAWTLILQEGLSSAPATGSGPMVMFTLDEPDSLVYRLVVSDGTLTDDTTVTVVVGPPTITGLAPNSGPVGTRVTITGTNFSPTPSQNAIGFFNGGFSPVLVATPTTLEVIVPLPTTTGPVVGIFQGRGGSGVTVNGPTFTVTGAATWAHVNTASPEGFNGVSTPDANTAFVVGTNGTIISTTDAGVTWSAPHTTNTAVELLDVAFTSPLTGVAGGRGGILLRTTDGGATPWATIPSGVSFSIGRFSFVDAMNGWAPVGAPAGNTPLLRTTDGGANWTPVTPAGVTFFCCNAVSFAPGSLVGIAVGLTSSAVLRTVDGGANWTVPSLPLTASLADVAMVDAQTGWAAGETASPRRALVLKTVDGGATWSNQTTNLPANIQGLTIGVASIHAVDAMNATIAGQGSMILRTTDGGATWVDEGTGTVFPPNDWNDVSFPPNNPVNGMVVTTGGIARRQ